MQRDGGMNTFHNEHLQRATHPHDRLSTVSAVADQLGDQRIIIGRDHAFGIGRRIDADPKPAGRMEGLDLARRRRKLFRMLGIDTAFNGMAALAFAVKPWNDLMHLVAAGKQKL
jgi:hypothetical protein